MRQPAFVSAFVGTALFAFSAFAVPIGGADVTLIANSEQNAANNADVYAAGFAANTPIGATWLPNNPTVTPPPNSVSGFYKSPFQNATITPGGSNGPTYFSVGGRLAGEGAPSPSTLVLAEERGFLNILWGSIDEYNKLEFLDISNTVIAAITGTQLINTFGLGGVAPNFEQVALLNIVTPAAFKSLRFFSEGPTGQDIPAFEFALQPVPLPAAVWMMIAALAGLGFVGRRKRVAA